MHVAARSHVSNVRAFTQIFSDHSPRFQISIFLLCMFKFLLLYMFRFMYSVNCLCVNVCCAAATGCQPNIYHIISSTNSKQSVVEHDEMTLHTV
jgi:hypothetical protein